MYSLIKRTFLAAFLGLALLSPGPVTHAQPGIDDLFDVPLAREPRLLSLVAAGLDHPILSELRLSARVEPYNGQDPESFLAVVIHSASVDGDVADLELLNRAIGAGVGVMVLDASAADKTALRRHLGITFNDGQDSLGYFFDLSRDRHAEIFELPKRWSPAPEDLEAVPTRPEFGPAAQAVEATFNRGPVRSSVQPDDPAEVARYVGKVYSYLAETRGAQEGVSIDAVGPPNIPAAIKKWTTTIHVQNKRTLGHRQEAQLDFEIVIAAYLNNPPAGDHFQYVYVETNGILVPGKLAHNSSYHRGWFQRDLRMRVAPEANPSIVLADTAPNNVSGVRSVTDGVSFDIGFSADGVSSTFGFSQSTTRDIADWRIIEDSTPPVTSWRYFQNHPFDGRGRRCCAGGSRDCAMNGLDKVKSPPTLSKFTLTTNTQAVWRTTSVLDDVLQFGYSFEQTLGDYHSKVIHWNCHQKRNTASGSFMVDLNKIQ